MEHLFWLEPAHVPHKSLIFYFFLMATFGGQLGCILKLGYILVINSDTLYTNIQWTTLYKTPEFYVVKSQRGNIYGGEISMQAKHWSSLIKKERLHDGSQPHRQLTPLHIPTMHYILHERSYMSKLLPVMPIMRNFP